MKQLGIVSLLLALTACSSPVPAGPDAGTDAASSAPDTGESSPDAPSPDAFAIDAPISPDATTVDAGPRRCESGSAFGTPRMVALDPGGADSSSASLTADELQIAFVSVRLPNAGGRDIWAAERTSPTGTFGTPHRFDGLATAYHETEPAFDETGLDLFFRRDNSTEADLMFGHRSSSAIAFDSSAAVTATSTTVAEVSPFMTGSALYFARETGGGLGREIWRAPRVGSTIGTPERVAELGTSSDEQEPVLSQDELTIYWVSARTDAGSRGGDDIWRATRTTTSAVFTDIENVAELNTTGSESPDFLSVDGCRLYFTRIDGTVAHVYVAER